MADITIQVGANLTNGLGAGARPEIGREAVEENRHEIEESIEGADMVFVTAGMGGGTGTGGAPVVSGIAKRKGILTVGIVTTPFDCEGPKRMKYALEGITELKKNSDTVIVIPNERLMDIADEDTTLLEAFEQANQVLYNATRGISDLILMPGLINLDFADVRTTMLDGGAAIMGSANASGEDRAEIAAREAINSPLLDGVSIRGARNVLVNISSGANLGMKETTTATSIIQQEAGEDAEIILGTVLDESYDDELRVTVIATGFDLADSRDEARVAPNTAKNATGSKKKSISNNNLEMPKASEVTGHSRYSSTNEPFYKGEKNLKQMDQPAFHRRGLKNVRPLNKEEEEENNIQDEQKQGNELLNNRRERIDKSDSDQPAFLRKIMD
jgi:cell division protein FtsZ